MLKAAIVGFGGIAKSHRMGYANLKAQGKVELVCACDIDPEAVKRRIVTNIDGEASEIDEEIRFYTDLDEMLDKEKLDFVDICAPTFLHAELSKKVLGCGIHVLCEKPMALSFSDCEEMIQASKNAGKELMIGQCLRFYPAFDYIKAAVDDKRFGKVIGGFFSRLSAPPTWGWENWFMNPERSGGCITDLHVHDVDIIRYLLGEPEAVSCRASTSVCVNDTVHTSFYYGDTPITAIGDWSLFGFPFNASCLIDFECATVTYGAALTVYPKNGDKPYDVELAAVSGYQGEIDYFCDVIEGKIKNDKNPASSAATTIRLIERMRESVSEGGKILSFR